MVKFSCEKALVQQAVAAVSRAVAAKSSVPALEGILLECGDGLRMSGYNMQTGIRTTVEAAVSEAGHIVLNARLFGEMIRRLPDDMVTFEADDKLNVKLNCGDASFELPGLSADDYPELPEVDGIMGTGSYGEIVPALAELMAGGRPCRFADIHGMIDEFDRVLTTPGHYAYLRIAEGCDNRCAYCVIPSLRGRYRSRRMEDVLAEARKLSDAGVRECIVIAQDITRYGIDLYGERKLAALLRELCKMDFR